MSLDTISYSVKSQGWNSRHSYQPDMMLGINSTFYTWNNGDLYIHHDNATRNAYYINPATSDYFLYDSSITTIFNQEPTQSKMFETICLEGDSAWKVELTTDSTTGVIESTYFKEKEGERYAFIRRDPNTIDLAALSTQGVGTLASYATLVLTFGFEYTAPVSVGDKAYKVAAGSLTFIGNITALTPTTITVDAAAVLLNPGDIIVIVKDSTAESVGARGYYMETVLTNSETTEVELFSVSSSADKSSP